jgi:hypothetical protein
MISSSLGKLVTFEQLGTHCYITYEAVVLGGVPDTA